MAVISNCPSCQRPLRVPDEMLGRQVKCPSCGVTFAASDAGGDPAGIVDPVPVTDAVREPVADLPPPLPADGPPPPPRLSEGPTDVIDAPPPSEKPGKVQAIGFMALFGGIYALLHGVGGAVGSHGLCCLWPGTYFSIVLGILAVIRGSALLGETAYRESPPQGIAIMQIINIINADVINCVLGIVTLVFLNESEVRRYFRGGK